MFKVIRSVGMLFLSATAMLSAYADTPEVISLYTQSSSAEVSLMGGRVISFKTKGEELLWTPQAWSYADNKWCHGGIPICWPWFGRVGPVTNCTIHGFAWHSRFAVRKKNITANRSELVLGLKSSDLQSKEWPYDFDLEYTIVLTDKLNLHIKTKNTGDKSFKFTGGFHPYFFIGDRDRTVVTGTDGLKFRDSRVSKVFNDVWKGDMKLLSSFDHVFAEVKAAPSHTIVDPVLDRRITGTSSGVTRLVVWNPGVEGAAYKKPGPGDLAIGDWRHLVCVEPAVIGNDVAIDLQPGATHVMSTEISLVKGVE